ncbi:MAG: GHKL domain-containing protein [Candidatus Omnitrophica bacterium]|nr:GHKL domain-containing protein [Candidatus Omnitrophota bacterium]
MDSVDQDFKGANEIGKIFNSFLDKKLLCDFFLDSVLTFIRASHGYLYLVGNSNQLWLETSTGEGSTAFAEELKPQAEAIFQKGQPVSNTHFLMIPLIVRNHAIGVACFIPGNPGEAMTDKEFALAQDMTSQLAGALHNLLLFEQNLKMERLAAIGQTTSIVMHELTNILQLAKLADECLRRGLENNHERYLTRGLAGLKKALKEMDGFAYEMLSLTKDYKITPIPIELKAVFEELKTDLQEKAAQARVRLETQCEDGFHVEGEPRSLYRALLNMMKNAMEAADKDDAYIRVSARSVDETTYQILVEDNGQGMTEEVKARIFQAFFSTKGERGTGLGLMIIDRTVKAHQGEIRIESQAGKGTTFFLTFPKKLNPA